jgi:hypothetical protein
MITVNITLQFVRDGAKESKRLRLSMEDSIGETVNRLVRDLALPLDDDGQPLSYHLVRHRQVLASEDRLFEAGVQEGDIMQLAILDPQATMGQSISAGLLNRLGGKTASEPLPIRATLVAPTGQSFELHHSRALIGRADPNLGYPADAFDADLTNLDPNRTVSRPHALIVYNNGQFTIRDLYSQRGLLLNDMPVSPSKSTFLQDGDVLTLGDVKVQFRCEG